MRRTAGYSILLDQRINEDISEEINADAVEKKLAQYKQIWLNYTIRMENISCPNQELDY
jgi:hypothetical protein